MLLYPSGGKGYRAFSVVKFIVIYKKHLVVVDKCINIAASSSEWCSLKY